MKRIKFFLPLLVFIVLGLFLLRGLKLDPNELPSALIDKPLPAFTLSTLENGQPVTGKQLLGKKALINVWATWCVTCRVEHPYLMQLSSEGVLLYGINYKDNPEDARRWLLEKGNPFQFSIMDTEGKLGIDLGVFGAPETYFIDSAGIIRHKHVGELNPRVWQDSLKGIWDSLD